jgi:hypothetical protein
MGRTHCDEDRQGALQLQEGSSQEHRAMSIPLVRPATLDDLQALTDIYNYYVVNTTITFDLRPFTPEERRSWFDDHRSSGPHRLLVATDAHGRCVG